MTLKEELLKPVRLLCLLHLLLELNERIHVKVKSESEVAQSYPTLSDPMDCSLSGSSVHGILQARVLEWGAIAFSILGRREAIFDLSHFVS